MKHSNTDAIRKTIELGRQLEAKDHALEQYLRVITPRLHRAVRLPEHNATEALLCFAVGYIEQVPALLDTLTRLMHEADIYREGRVFVEIAEDFFLRPPELVRAHSGLQALLDKAYLAHRLVEEVNDRLMMLYNVPLAPIDMTLANIVVHELLGEDFANQLDLAVHYAVEALFPSGARKSAAAIPVLADAQRSHQWRHTLEGWPRLTKDLTISLLQTTDEMQPVH